jgi:signal transduction histidine kinase
MKRGPTVGGGTLRSLVTVLEHEMRTPLAASLIQLGAAEAALQGPASMDVARAALANASRQLRALSSIVRRAVQIETAERIDLVPEHVDLREVVTEMISRYQATAPGAWSRVEVRAGKALVGEWDPTAVVQILENLLSNALKYSRDSPVVLTIVPFRGGARLSVRDAGVGIDEKYRERIFGRFVRAPSTRALAGTGIGLWVVRHLVDAHGGRVLVRSRPGKWTVLEVWLPELASARRPAARAARPARPSARLGASSL